MSDESLLEELQKNIRRYNRVTYHSRAVGVKKAKGVTIKYLRVFRSVLEEETRDWLSIKNSEFRRKEEGVSKEECNAIISEISFIQHKFNECFGELPEEQEEECERE